MIPREISVLLAISCLVVTVASRALFPATGKVQISSNAVLSGERVLEPHGKPPTGPVSTHDVGMGPVWKQLASMASGNTISAGTTSGTSQETNRPSIDATSILQTDSTSGEEEKKTGPKWWWFFLVAFFVVTIGITGVCCYVCWTQLDTPSGEEGVIRRRRLRFGRKRSNSRRSRTNNAAPQSTPNDAEPVSYPVPDTSANTPMSIQSSMNKESAEGHPPDQGEPAKL